MLANAGMVTYIVMGLILGISSIFALNFGAKISRALKTNDQSSFEWRFCRGQKLFCLLGHHNDHLFIVDDHWRRGPGNQWRQILKSEN